MVNVSFLQYTEAPLSADGLEWYGIEKEKGSLLVLRSGQAGPKKVAGLIVNEWHGTRLLRAGSEEQGEFAFHLRFPVPEDYAYEFEAWYRFEHVPLLLEEPTWYACEFFRAAMPSSFSFAAIHYLERSALTSQARDRSVETPWWKRLAKLDWFDSGFERMRLLPLQGAKGAAGRQA